jgi:hypothetical protein
VESHPFSFDPVSGNVTTFHYDHVVDKFTLETSVDLQPLIDTTREMYKEAPTHWRGTSALGHHVASIPAVLWPELAKKGIMYPGGRIKDKAKLKEWLNDRDSQAFRTRPGRI